MKMIWSNWMNKLLIFCKSGPRTQCPIQGHNTFVSRQKTDEVLQRPCEEVVLSDCSLVAVREEQSQRQDKSEGCVELPY